MALTGSPVRYECNDGELIKFTGMEKKQLYIFANLNNLFIKKGCWEMGTFVSEYDTMLSGTPPAGIQMRRLDIAYFTKQQVENTKKGEDEIPEFVIEIISGNDQINLVEKKIVEYYKAGVVWLILPEEKTVHVYTSRKQVQICTDDDICSAKPVLPDFEISVNAIFA